MPSQLLVELLLRRAQVRSGRRSVRILGFEMSNHVGGAALVVAQPEEVVDALNMRAHGVRAALLAFDGTPDDSVVDARGHRRLNGRE